MSKAARGFKTRADIVQAGAHLFSLHGYAATGLSELLGTLGLSKGAFYHHFKCKHDLLLAVLLRLRADYDRELLSHVWATEDPALSVKTMLRRLVELNESGQWLNCLLLARLAQETGDYSDSVKREIAAVLEWLLDSCERLLHAGQNAGAVRGDMPPRRLAQFLLYSWLGAIVCRDTDVGLMSLQPYADHLEQMLSV